MEARPRQRFSPVVPQVSCIGAVGLATDYQGGGPSPTDDPILLEEQGRAVEKQEILEREQLADAFRGAEPAPGRKTFAVTAALRAALIEAQLRDPALAELLRRLAGRTESIAGSAGRIVVPAGKVEKLYDFPLTPRAEAVARSCPRAKVFCPVCHEQVTVGEGIRCRICGHSVHDGQCYNDDDRMCQLCAAALNQPPPYAEGQAAPSSTPATKAVSRAASGFRIAEDGALEALWKQSDGQGRWVVVVPDGNYRANASWKSFFFESAHVGPFGGHRNADQTIEMLRRWCLWNSLVVDVKAWVDACYACVQFRRRPRKVLSSPIVARHHLPWHHVLVDFEGPITPADRDGGRYILKYICLVCGGCMLEVVEALTHSQVRRAFLACVLRAKTLPMLLGHDGDQAFTNLLFSELEALLSIECHRPSLPADRAGAR